MGKLTKFIPEPLKSISRPVYSFLRSQFRNITTRRKSREDLNEYWRHPYDGLNAPKDYVGPVERSEYLLKFIKKYANPEDKILEIGCNVGRNLNCLFNSGYKNLEGIEISEDATDFMKSTYPAMARQIKIYTASAEDIIETLKNEYDIVFTMAVFQHIHPDSNFIFPEVVKITKKYLITIEDEGGISWRHFHRNYKKVFELIGMRQVEEFNCKDVNGFDPTYWLRVFKKKNNDK